MKKFIFMIVSILTLTMLASCSSCNRHSDVDEPSVTVGGIPFDLNVRADYDALTEEFGENLKFFETTITLDAAVDTVQNFEVLEMQSVYQIPDTVITYTYTDEGLNVVKEYGHWLEDCPILPEHVKFSLADAIEALQESNIVVPSSDKVVLRRPLGPKVLTSAYYIFGTTHTGFVAVNAVNGEVLPMDDLFKVDEEEITAEVDTTVVVEED